MRNHPKEVRTERPRNSFRVPRFLSDEAVKRVLALPLSARDKAIVHLGLFCGLRISEIAGLELSDVYWQEKNLLVFGKRSKERLIPIPFRVLGQLKSYVDTERPALLKPVRTRTEDGIRYRENPNQSLFLNHNGEPLSSRSVSEIIRHRLRQPGFPTNGHRLTPHSLRHTYATNLFRSGAGLEKVSQLLGHENPLSTTHVYIGLLPSLMHADVEKAFEKFSL